MAYKNLLRDNSFAGMGMPEPGQNGQSSTIYGTASPYFADSAMAGMGSGGGGQYGGPSRDSAMAGMGGGGQGVDLMRDNSAAGMGAAMGGMGSQGGMSMGGGMGSMVAPGQQGGATITGTASPYFPGSQPQQQSQQPQQAQQATASSFAAPQYNNAVSTELGKYTSNPFLADMFKGIEQQGTQNLQNNILPGVRYGAAAAGGFGGTRQGIAEGNAIGQAQSAISAQKAQVGQADFNSSQDRAIQKYSADSAAASAQSVSSNNYNMGMAQLKQQGAQFDMTNATQNRQFNANNSLANRQTDNSYNLGMGNLGNANRQTDNSYALGRGNLDISGRQTDNNYTLGQGNLANANRQTDNSYNLGMGNLSLGNTQANNNFYTANRGQDLQSIGLGAQLYGQGNAGYVGQGAGIQGIGNTQQQAPWQAIGNATSNISPFTGYGGSTTSSQQGNAVGGAFGGALAGAQFGNLFGGGGGQSNYGSGITGSGGWSTQGGQYNNPSAY